MRQVQVYRWVGRAIGLDLHRDFCEIAICEEGVVRSAGRLSITPQALEAFAASLEATDRVALEVSGGAWEVARLLEGHVQKVIVVSPDDTGIAQARTKTDKLDARALAKLLWQGRARRGVDARRALPGVAPAAIAPRAAGALANALQGRGARGADAPAAGQAAVL
jgi:hypothetical protein